MSSIEILSQQTRAQPPNKDGATQHEIKYLAEVPVTLFKDFELPKSPNQQQHFGLTDRGTERKKKTCGWLSRLAPPTTRFLAQLRPSLLIRSPLVFSEL